MAAEDDKIEVTDTVVVHGFRDKGRAIGLIYSLAEIPCYPSVIFRIDQRGTLVGAIDQLRSPARIYYVRVLNWNRGGDNMPVIAWTLRPQDIHSSLSSKARRMLGVYSSKLRGREPMTVKVSVQKHAELHARMVRCAS